MCNENVWFFHRAKAGCSIEHYSSTDEIFIVKEIKNRKTNDELDHGKPSSSINDAADIIFLCEKKKLWTNRASFSIWSF